MLKYLRGKKSDTYRESYVPALKRKTEDKLFFEFMNLLSERSDGSLNIN